MPLVDSQEEGLDELFGGPSNVRRKDQKGDPPSSSSSLLTGKHPIASDM